MFQIFEHTADLGLRVRAATLDGLFVEAASALMSIIIHNLQDVRHIERRDYQLDGDQYDYLLFDWLNELLYTFDTQKWVCARSDARVSSTGLTATCYGEPLDLSRHRPDHEVKAITYHGLKVESCPDGWLAEVIVDI